MRNRFLEEEGRGEYCETPIDDCVGFPYSHGKEEESNHKVIERVSWVHRTYRNHNTLPTTKIRIPLKILS